MLPPALSTTLPSDAFARATEYPRVDPLDAHELLDEMGLSLSGGGFRAMVFHLGALWRLNELGLLSRIARFSSVSGGSLTSGALAAAWRDLDFDATSGVAANFAERVVKPVLALAGRSVGTPAILMGLLPFLHTQTIIADAYDRALFHGAGLRDLPEQPQFVFNATNLMSGGLFRISQNYAADYRVGLIDRPDFPLASVVAASAAAPPLLPPLDFKFGKNTVSAEVGTTLTYPPYTEHALLADGGIYDNLGLEPVWKRYRTVLVSNAGLRLPPQKRPVRIWPLNLFRVVDIIHAQVDAQRERQLMALAHEKLRRVAYWSIQTDPTKFTIPTPLDMSAANRARVAAIHTKLEPLSQEECELLIYTAYLLSDLALRQYADPADALPPPIRFPDIAGLF